jgi:hypothetical protein
MKSDARGRIRKAHQKSAETKLSVGLALLYVVRLRYVSGGIYQRTSNETNKLNG